VCTSQQLMDDWFLEMAFVHKVCMCVSVFPPPRAFTWMDLLKKFSIQFQEGKFILRTPVSYVLSTYPFIMILSRLGSLINSWYMRMEVESAISSKLPTKEILQYSVEHCQTSPKVNVYLVKQWWSLISQFSHLVVRYC